MSDTAKNGEAGRDGNRPPQQQEQGEASARAHRSGRSGDGFDSVIPAMHEQELERQHQLDGK